MSENGGSLDFIFVSSPRPVVDEKRVSSCIICCSVRLQKIMQHMMFWSIKTFVNGRSNGHFHFPILSTALSFMFDACLHHVSLIDCRTLTTLLIFGSAFAISRISADAPYIQKRPITHFFVHGWTFFLLFASAHFQITCTAPIKLLHHFGFVCVLILDYAK